MAPAAKKARWALVNRVEQTGGSLVTLKNSAVAALSQRSQWERPGGWPNAKSIELFRNGRARLRAPPWASIDDVVANIDHVAKVAGIDHVGIGTDFDGIGNDVPKGLEDASKMPALAAALRKKGYSEADVEKVMGGNFLRVMKQVIGK